MSLVFVVGSEEQINLGVGWCAKLTNVRPQTLEVVVLGCERKTLREYAKRTIATHLGCDAETINVALVKPDADDILAHAKSVECDRMLLIHEANNTDPQRAVFQSSMYPTLWLRTTGSPAKTFAHAHSAFRRPSRVTALAANKFFDNAPLNTLCEQTDLDRDDLVDSVKTSMAEQGISSTD